jgi:hypothetical protein
VTRLRRPRVRLIAGIVIPVATYLILRRSLNSDALAFTATAAMPIAWMLAVGLWERRIDPIAVGASIVLGVAFAISIATGGSALPLELRRAVVSGSVGLACLISVLVRRPLLPAAIDLLERAWPRSQRVTRAIGGRASAQQMMVVTAIVAVICLCDAAAQVTLALTVSTATFVAVTGLTRLGVFAAGLGVCVLYLRRAPTAHAASGSARAPAETRECP